LNDASGHRVHQVHLFQLTQSLKKPPPKKGGRLFGVLHQDLQGTWHTTPKADI